MRLKLVNMGRDIHEDGRGEDEEDVGEDTELLSTASLEGLDFDRWNYSSIKRNGRLCSLV